MNCRKLFLTLTVAMLGASFVHQASAQWGTGGSLGSPRKTHLNGFDLFCDLDRVTFNTGSGNYTIPPSDRVKINTRPTALVPLAPGESPSITISGEMFCAEVLPGTTGLENAVSGFKGRFKLEQKSPAQRPTSSLTHTETGWVYCGPENGCVANPPGVRTWTFQVPASPAFPFPELLYDLLPLDAGANAFCEASATNCKALFGLQLPATQADYPARDLDNADGDNNPTTGVDLALGQVIKFSTTTTMAGGAPSEVPGKLFWGPCHSQAFIDPKTFVVDAFLHSSNSGAGAGLFTGITVAGTSVAITANQNDLWNSGGCSPSCRFSNADGQVRTLIATGHDDSFPAVNSPNGTPTGGHGAGTVIGVDWLTINGGDHSEAGRLSNKPFGALVGAIGTQFFVAGTAYNNSTPPAGALNLFYWDSFTDDNTGSIEVTVAEKSIQCTAPSAGGPVQVSAVGNTSGVGKVLVKGFPTLNVSNKSTKAVFPFTVLACNVGEETIAFGPDGSPIVTTGNVRVRLSSGSFSDVAIEGFSVVDKVSLPSCDSGAALADLDLKLNNMNFIDAVVPGTQCQLQKMDGPVDYVVRLNTTNGGFVEGQDSVQLSNCKRL